MGSMLLDALRIDQDMLVRLARITQSLTASGEGFGDDDFQCLINANVKMIMRPPVQLELYWRPDEAAGSYLWHIEPSDGAVAFDYGKALSLEDACEALCQALTGLGAGSVREMSWAVH